MKRMKNEEIIIMKTDKSGKFVVTTPEKYIEMGEDHTNKDTEISWAQMRELEKNVSEHAVAWEMIWNTGEDHNHQDRIIKSKSTKSRNQANLKLLFKDHKQGNKTRPVASGNESFNIGLSNGVSDLLESVAKTSRDPYSVISAEDLLARVTAYNKNSPPAPSASRAATPVPAAEGSTPSPLPTESENKEEEMSLVGSDVVALFPSITAERSARIVRDEIQRSEITFEGFDDEKARTYIYMNKEKITDYEDIAHLLPKRKAKTGTAPTMASIGRKWDPNNQWEFPDENISSAQTRKLIGLVAEIATIVLFTNFSYKFGGKFYKQKSGGPIGVRATGAVAQLVMESWARKYREILENSGLKVPLMAGYVDDGRQVTSVLEPGMRFDKESGIFHHSPVAEEEDKMKKNQGETSNQRMARVCREAMNNINKDLVFTTESQEEFPNERLPTLDFQMWMKENKIYHTYYQKPMRTPLVIMERSAISNQQKFSILGNELCRRLSNVQIEVIEHRKVLEIVEEFIRELKNSEYSIVQSREIVNSGLRGWKKKIARREKKNIPFYRPASSTVEVRLRKNLLERESWYK